MVKPSELATFACTFLSQSLHAQNQSTATTAAQPGILKEYDQAIDHIAERAMGSVVEIEVTGYGVPEKDRIRDNRP